MGRHHVPEAPPPPKNKPRYRFVVAVGGIALLAFVAMAIVAAVYPERGPKAVADQDPGVSANPFPTLPPGPSVTTGPTPGAGITSTTRPGSSRPPTSVPGTTTPPAGNPPTTQPTGAVSGAYSLPPDATWPDRFQGQVSLTNSTSSSQTWQVRIVFPDNVTPTQTAWINASPAPSTVTESHGATFTGSVPIAAGKTVVMFFEFLRTAGDLKPKLCTVNGRTCSGV